MVRLIIALICLFTFAGGLATAFLYGDYAKATFLISISISAQLDLAARHQLDREG